MFTDDAEYEKKNDEDRDKEVDNDKIEHMDETEVENERNNENEKVAMEAEDCFTMKRGRKRKGIVLILGKNKTIPLLLDKDKIETEERICWT